MAVEASSKDLVFSFPEWQVNTFSVDCTGTRAVLAVQKWMAVVSLEADQDAEKFSEPTALRKLARQNKYEIKAVAWCPHPARQSLLASACQQKVEIWDVKAERHPQLLSIRAHTRPVSDVGWSIVNPHLLASCATDSFVQVWDTRDTKRPKTSFKAVAGASLVQWNRLNENIVASAHDSDIRIWDLRKPTTASGYISAHMSRIHDLDWSYFYEKQLTTCSHDASIKFWDISSPKEPMSTIKAGSQPLWRARNYPVGHAVAMVLVPAMHSGDSRVFLWGRSNVASPLHIFTGHSEAVLEVQWRRYKGGCDLVTWSKDKTLRVWGINEELRQSLGGEASEQITIPESMSQRGSDPSLSLSMSLEGEGVEASLISSLAEESLQMSVRSLKEGGLSQSSLSASPTKSVSSMLLSDSQSSLSKSLSASLYKGHTLEKEFKLLNLDSIPNLELERQEASQRSCTVKVEQGGHLVRVGITFPAHYPNGAAPSFIFDKSTTIDMSVQQDLNRVITDTANLYVKQNMPCLEHCLKKLSKGLESFMSRPQPPIKQPDFDISFGLLDDEHIPFPRTSGARFSVNGHLVCFYCPTSSEVGKKPRSLDKINAYKSSHIRSTVRGQSRWSGYLSSSLPKRSSTGANLDKMATASLFSAGEKSTSPFTCPVDIHDAIPMLPIDLGLAKAYSISSSDIKELCTVNASAACQFGRMDLVQVWSVAALVADIDIEVPPTPDDGTPWPEHPFGKGLIQSLFDHFAKLHDVQTLAVLACIFQEHCLQFDQKHMKLFNNSHTNNDHVATAISRSLVSSGSPPKKYHGQAPPTPTTSLPPHPFSHGHAPQERSPWSVSSSSVPVTSPISGSWQEVSESDLGFHEGEDPLVEEQAIHEVKCRLLDPLLTRQCDEYRRVYADILYAWDLLDKRSEVLKYQVGRLAQNSQAKLRSICHQCGQLVKGPSCKDSHCFAFTCSICNLSVRGSSTFCLSCGHGGHSKHMIEWFSKYSTCPAGCDCFCLESSGWT